MTHPRHFLRVPAVILTVALLAAAGCSSSDSTGDSTTPVDDVSETAEDTVADTVASGDDAAPVTAAPEPADTAGEAQPDATTAPVDAGGSSDVLVALDDGRSWTLQKNLCTFDPGATGPAAAVINIDGSDDADVQVIVLEAWPFDGSTDNGTSFLGTFSDENEEVLVLLKDAATMVGDEVEVTGGYYTNVFYQDGDVFDGTYTVRCQP